MFLSELLYLKIVQTHDRASRGIAKPPNSTSEAMKGSEDKQSQKTSSEDKRKENVSGTEVTCRPSGSDLKANRMSFTNADLRTSEAAQEEWWELRRCDEICDNFFEKTSSVWWLHWMLRYTSILSTAERFVRLSWLQNGFRLRLGASVSRLTVGRCFILLNIKLIPFFGICNDELRSSRSLGILFRF